MKILINCYACSPYKGSEPGMGWNFVKCLATQHQLHIITESKFQTDLEHYFKEHPDEQKYYHFYFIQKERHKKLRKIWPPSYYWFYQRWQKKALLLAKELDIKENFDLVHQLNMIGYREPGYLYKLNKPFIWGPIGGFNITPWRLLHTMGWKGGIFYAFRNIINLYQMHYSKRVKEAIQRSKAIICATQEDHDTVKRLWNKESIIIPEVGLSSSIHPITTKQKERKLQICWSGLHIHRKSLNLLIEALAICKTKTEIELHIIGNGECNRAWKRLARKKELENIIWHGWVEKEKAIEIMQQSHVFIITSLSDATSTVLLEALSNGIPVIALNHLGFANVITDKCGIKIDIYSQKQVITDLAKAIDYLCTHEKYRMLLSQGAINRAKEFSWKEKALIIHHIYQQVI